MASQPFIDMIFGECGARTSAQGRKAADGGSRAFKKAFVLSAKTARP